jgi:LuxR family maltose regulon positive regulatory protein
MSQMWPEAAPLLITKLHIPRASHSFVSRPRLTAWLNEGITRRLTLVSAPAGSGKTTLLSEWAHQSRDGKALPAAWISLDEGDNDPVRFWAYVVAALERVHAGVGSEAAQLLRSSPPAPIETVLAALLNAVAVIVP